MKHGNIQKDPYRTGFRLIILLIFFDYVRPQFLLPFLGTFRIPMVLILIISFLGIQAGGWKFRDWTSRAFIIWVMISAAYVPLAVNNFWAYQMTRSLVIYFLCYTGIKIFVSDRQKLDSFLSAWLTIGIFCAVRGILEGGKVINSGFLGDENDFALYLCMMLPIAYLRFFQARQTSLKLLYLLAIVVLLTGVIFSYSRGGLVGLAAVLVYCWLVSPRKKMILFIYGIILVVGLQFLPEDYKADMQTITQGTDESTAGERIYSWQCALRMFLDYPLFGVGPGNFPHRFAEYEPPEKWKGRGHGGRAAHSLYFTILPEFGMAGILLFLTMIYYPNRHFKKIRTVLEKQVKSRPVSEPILENYQTLRKMIYGILFGYLVAGIFLSVLYYPHFWIACALLTSLNQIFEKDIQERLQAGVERAPEE